MTPLDDDLPPEPRSPDIPALVWMLAGSVLALAFCVAIFLLRQDR
jgi:hypothetical protein